MARDETPPWPRGGTFNNQFSGTISATNLGGSQHLGKEWRFEDTTYGTNMYVTVRAVRNTGTFALLPGRVVSFDTTNLPAYQNVNGYTTTTNAPGCVLDEFLPSAGLLANDIGYVIIQGPCEVLTPLDGSTDNVFSVGDPIAAITAATSGATTAGRVSDVATALAASTNTGNAIMYVLGRAMSAATTANTNSLLLMHAKRWF